MTTDPSVQPPQTGSRSGDPAGGALTPRPGQICWVCGYAIVDPPQIIGQVRVARVRVAHRYCLRVLGELDLDLPPAS